MSANSGHAATLDQDVLDGEPLPNLGSRFGCGVHQQLIEHGASRAISNGEVHGAGGTRDHEGSEVESIGVNRRAAPIYSNGQGRAFLYFGNGGDGLDRTPRQARTDDAAPISLLGMSDSESAFRLKALGRTAAGRGGVRLQFEVKPAGVSFDGTGLVMGPVMDTGTPTGSGSAVPLTQLANGLTPETLYHWRLRIISDSPFFPRSPWMWLPYNATTEADVRTGEGTTAVDESSESLAPGLRLTTAAPNPFASMTRFAYTLPEGGRHRLAVYDVLGREVSVLGEGIRPAGRYTGQWGRTRCARERALEWRVFPPPRVR